MFSNFEKIQNIFNKGVFGGSCILSGPKGSSKLECANLFVKNNIEKSDIARNVYIIKPQKIVKKNKIREKEISIKQVREAVFFMNLKTQKDQKKICLIKKSEKLNLQSQNALLKSIEEPKKNSIFFLITENEKRLLPTIRSRSVLVKFGLKDPRIVKKQLRQASYSDEEIEKVVLLSWGKSGGAKRLIKNKAKVRELEREWSFLKDLLASPIYKKINLLKKKSDDIIKFAEVLDLWIVLLTAGLEKKYCEKFKNFSFDFKADLNQKQFLNLLNSLLILRNKIKYSNASAKLALETAFLI
ncbi:MAG: hypothetical protein GF335_01495 [Candidatus Moranbacteria bacterium]|nr:hypothetical protein [Candidatus Moranbacteria bacterium]